MSKPAFFMHVLSDQVAGEVWLNGAPILPLYTDVDQDAYPTISQWVIHGENELVVHVTDAGESPMVHVRLCQGHLGGDAKALRDNVLMAVEWPPPNHPEGEPAPPIPPRLEVKGQAAHPWGEWYWQRAPAFTDNRATLDALMAYVRDLHASVAAGNMDAVIAQSKIYYDECFPLYDMQPADGLAQVRGVWEHVSSKPGFALEPFNPDDLDLRLRCGWQLIQPLTLRGEQLIRQRIHKPGDPQWSLPIFIARTHFSALEGELAIVR